MRPLHAPLGLVVALATGLGACGGRASTTEPAPGAGEGDASDTGAPDATTSGWSLQLGVYAHCSFSQLGIVSGMGGVITLAESPSGALTVTFSSSVGPGATSDGGPLFSLRFTPTTGTSATLDPPGQSVPWEEFCFAGGATPNDSGFPPDPVPTPGTLLLTSGALTYDAETVFLSVVGSYSGELDACAGPSAAGSITCSRE